nr:hypothetical protein JVH1_6560 [Rhodococcus sp. JVH1]
MRSGNGFSERSQAVASAAGVAAATGSQVHIPATEDVNRRLRRQRDGRSESVRV